jgi:putative restriction endonuclease
MSNLAPQQVLVAFEGIRRAQRNGQYAPHKPLLLLLALARVQHGESRLAPFIAVERKLKELLTEFGPTNAQERRHLPFWHLRTDQDGALWQVTGPAALLQRLPGNTPTLGELRDAGVLGGFSPQIYEALKGDPQLLREVAARVLEAFFPATLQPDIAASVGLELEPAAGVEPSSLIKRRRDPQFRERVLRAYEYRCCVCGFDLRVGHMPAGLEGAHIQWHTVGGPDIETNGLCLCSLHHKLFDLGAFTIQPQGLRVIFSQHAVSADRTLTGVLAHHGKAMLAPQDPALVPGLEFLEWNHKNVFKRPHRVLSA